jgi:fructose-bisphosphate aldolase, class II
VLPDERRVAVAPPLAITRQRTARARELMARTRAERFAVGAFNADDLSTLRTICRAARASSAPVLIELNNSAIEMLGLSNVRDMLDNEIEDLGIEAYLNLDHAPTAAAATAAVDAGFEFVHLYVFQADPDATDDQVVAATQEIVEYARNTDAVVEGEQRYLTGSSTLHRDGIDPAAVAASLSSPEGARTFVKATGIDTFAAGIGNIHGRYPSPKQLDPDLLARLRAVVDVNISLHGGSGTPDKLYEAVARGGISKIDINSDLRYAYRTTLEQQFTADTGEYATVKLLDPVMDAVRSVVETTIHAFAPPGKPDAGMSND